MRTAIALCTAMGLSSPALATDSFYSEASHFAGGALTASVTTVVVDRYWPEHSENRVMIGFTVATAASVLGEIHDSMYGHPKKFSALDVASAALGGAAGALATDRWVLKPVVKTEHGARYYGLASEYRF